jgi:hypothetical protein
VTNENENGKDLELRPVIARLKEIQRKCDSMGARNEEFPLMKDRLTSMIARLEAGEEPSGEPIAYRAMARELFPVAHLFESVGFMGVGKELAHIERALQNFDPAPPSPDPSSAPARPVPTTSAVATSSATETGAHEGRPADTEDALTGEGVPKPILGGVLVLMIAIAVAAAIILKIGPFKPKPAASPIPAAPTLLPSPIQESAPTAAPRDSNPQPGPRERFADAMAQARLSLSEGDTDETIKYLSIASLIDRNDTSVIDVAGRIVDQFIDQASVAAADMEWDEAAQNLAEARSIARRFSLDPRRIDAAEHRFAEMEQFRIVDPEEKQALLAAIGKHVEVKLEDGTVLTGRIAEVGSSTLILDIDDDVGGGVVSFTDEVQISTIEWVKIWRN